MEMNLQKLKEMMYADNLRVFKELFLEDDEQIKYVIVPTEEVKDITILHKEELLELLDSRSLKLEYVEHWDFGLGLLGGQAVRVEYL